MRIDTRPFNLAGSALDLFPQFRIPGRAQDAARGWIDALAASHDYDWYVAVAPRSGSVGADPASVGASSTVEHQCSVVPGSLLWGLASFSTAAAGFKFEIWDAGAERPLAITKSFNFALAGGPGGIPAGAPNDGLAGPYILPGFYTIGEGGVVTVKITNLAAVANSLQLAMFFAQPKVMQGERQEYQR